jgi:hypothetical protein
VLSSREWLLYLSLGCAAGVLNGFVDLFSIWLFVAVFVVAFGGIIASATFVAGRRL